MNCPMNGELGLTEKQIENFCKHGCSVDCKKLLEQYIKNYRKEDDVK